MPLRCPSLPGHRVRDGAHADREHSRGTYTALRRHPLGSAQAHPCRPRRAPAQPPHCRRDDCALGSGVRRRGHHVIPARTTSDNFCTRRECVECVAGFGTSGTAATSLAASVSAMRRCSSGSRPSTLRRTVVGLAVRSAWVAVVRRSALRVEGVCPRVVAVSRRDARSLRSSPRACALLFRLSRTLGAATICARAARPGTDVRHHSPRATVRQVVSNAACSLQCRAPDRRAYAAELASPFSPFRHSAFRSRRR